MSIKSQKSLNEECSEIFERSYSVRSESDESVSGDDEDDVLSRLLMQKMSPRVLTKLKKCFKKNKERARSIDVDKRVEEVMRAAAAEEGIEFAPSVLPPSDNLWLDENGFVTAITNIFGDRKYLTHAQKLFRVTDRFSCGKVWWGQLVARLVGVGATRLASRVDSWDQVPEPSVKRLQHCKREMIVKLVYIEHDDSFCYAAVSKGGRVGIYDGDLQLLNSYEVVVKKIVLPVKVGAEQTADGASHGVVYTVQIFYDRTGVRRRVKNCWITDAVYLSDVRFLLACASDRSLTIYDAKTLSHSPLYCITGLPNIPTCAAYRAAMGMRATSELALGDALGDIQLLTFTHPRLQLLHSSAPDSINYYYWMELFSPHNTPHVTINTWRRVHSRAVRHVSYARDGDILVSCSHDNTTSVRIRHVPGKIDDYTFKAPRGVTCFAWVEKSRTLALCSAGAVLLWSTSSRNSVPLAPSPTTARALDIACVFQSRLLLIYYDNCTIHIWDLDEECLLQTIKVKFPFLGTLGKKMEFGTSCMFPGPPRRKVQQVLRELDTPSRRGSSVFQGSTGGLMLIDDVEDNAQMKNEDDTINERFNRSEILITCCDYVAVISMRDADGEVLPPPGDTLQARRPSLWDLTSESLFFEDLPSRRPSHSSPSLQLLEPRAAEQPAQDLDHLLENAGLKGILEKDFALMQGFRYDLNRKMAAMETNQESIITAVNVGAPYLALKTFEPEPMLPVDEIEDKYKRVMRLCPSSSITATPSASHTPTPRNNISTKL